MKTRLPGNFFPSPLIWSMCFVLLLTTSGCAFNSSLHDPEKFFKFDRSQSLEKFEGVYDNRGYNVPALTSFIWPAAEVPPLDKVDVAIEIRFKHPNVLIVRVYRKASQGLHEDNLVKQGVFEEGKDFVLEGGVISDRRTSNTNYQNTEDAGAFMPAYDTSDALLKRSFVFGIDQYGNGKLRTAKYEAGSLMLVPLVVKLYSDTRYPRLAD